MVEGGTTHGWNKSTDQLVCLEVPPAPYIKDQGDEAGGQEEGTPGRSPTPTGSRTSSFPSWSRRGKGREGERGKEGGCRPPPCPIRTRGGGGAWPALTAPPLLH